MATAPYIPPKGHKNFTEIAINYANRASDPKNSKIFGIWIRFAAKRFINDLSRANNPSNSFIFDAEQAQKICRFAEKLPHIEGTWDTVNIVLHESHVFFLVQLFGFRKPDGTRRFTTALFAVARKNAKSTLASIIALYCQNCEGENAPQVITGATTGAQARIVFNVAKAMVNRKESLREHFGLEAFANAIASYNNGGTLKPINAKASTQDGLNPSCTVLDEIHAHKNGDLLNVLKSAAGARRNPLFLFLTTEGYENPGPWQEEREFAKRVLQGIIEADHYLALYYAVDEFNEALGTKADDDFDESIWCKANPLMEVNPLLLEAIRKAAIDAKDKPSEHAEFKIKRLNRPSSVADGWVNLTKWRECRKPVDLKALRKFPCYGGLDLSSTTDLSSFRLLWPVGPVPGVTYTYGWRFVPAAAVRRRKQRGLIPFAGWVLSGHLIESGSEAIDYMVIERIIIEANETYNLVDVGYDGWNASQSVQRLTDAGVQMEQFIQGPKSYHPAMQAIEVAYLTGNLAHGNDPVLNWNASNMVARLDENLNQAPAKKRATEKIDDFCALLMAQGRAIADEDGFGNINDAFKSPVAGRA